MVIIIECALDSSFRPSRGHYRIWSRRRSSLKKVLTRTVVEADMHDTVLDQANVILRYLLGAHLLSCLASPRVVFYSIDISVLCKLAEGLMFLDIPPGKTGSYRHT